MNTTVQIMENAKYKKYLDGTDKGIIMLIKGIVVDNWSFYTDQNNFFEHHYKNISATFIIVCINLLFVSNDYLSMCEQCTWK